jgi:hypothetical protein
LDLGQEGKDSHNYLFEGPPEELKRFAYETGKRESANWRESKWNHGENPSLTITEKVIFEDGFFVFYEYNKDTNYLHYDHYPHLVGG